MNTFSYTLPAFVKPTSLDSLFYALTIGKADTERMIQREGETPMWIARLNRINLAREILRHATGTSDYSLEVLIAGGIDRWPIEES